MNVTEFVNGEYFAHAGSALAVSTFDGYRKLWRKLGPYLEGRDLALRVVDCQGILRQVYADSPHLNRIDVDVTIADPPTGETALDWDKWPCAWIQSLPGASFWCFGTLRMFRKHMADFQGWKLSQDIVWEKHNGTGMMVDRFRRVHEQIAHFYKGKWSDVHHEAQKTMDATARQVRRKQKPSHWSKISSGHFVAIDGGPRLMRSVLRVRSEHGRAENPTQKPLGILLPIIHYSCPDGGTVLDPMMGSGSTLVAAKLTGRSAIGIDIRESECEIAAKRLRQEVLNFSEVPA